MEGSGNDFSSAGNCRETALRPRSVGINQDRTLSKGESDPKNIKPKVEPLT